MSSSGGYALSFLTTLCGVGSGAASFFLCDRGGLGWGWYLFLAGLLVMAGAIQASFVHATDKNRICG